MRRRCVGLVEPWATLRRTWMRLLTPSIRPFGWSSGLVPPEPIQGPQPPLSRVEPVIDAKTPPESTPLAR